MIFWIILLYLSFAAVDVLDKVLLSKGKIKPLDYTFFTLVTGALLLLAWPFVYEPLPFASIKLDLLSGAYFGLVMYVFFKLLSFGEVSRVIPFVFSLVPVFDILLSKIFGKNILTASQLSAMALLIPGAFLISYHHSKHKYHHWGLGILSAFLYSSYNFLWQYGASTGSSLNNLMWNRLGAAVIMLSLLIIPELRKIIFSVKNLKTKKHIGGLFLFKQGLGGFNFVVLSHFLAVGNVAVIDSLSGFRYAFLFAISLFLSKKYQQILQENNSKGVVKLKFVALALVFAGTLILALK